MSTHIQAIRRTQEYRATADQLKVNPNLTRDLVTRVVNMIFGTRKPSLRKQAIESLAADLQLTRP